MAVTPATYGTSERPPRGDYSAARVDYTCDQDWSAYTAAEHELYARLCARQARQIKDQACNEFIHTLPQLGSEREIPRFESISLSLRRATGWEIVAVPGLIPERAFFSLLASRRFPVTVWLRRPEEFDYVVEPDVFHDLFGHVPLLFNPVFADYMQAFGAGGLKAQDLSALEYLARLYWYTVEFGLIATPKGLRAYGAGILSSAGETAYALTSMKPQRLPFELERVLRTPYGIDSFQHTYFVVDSFAQLFDATAPDFAPIYQRVSRLPGLTAKDRLPGERVVAPNPAEAPMPEQGSLRNL
ncbi:MAG TPA: phenylalanine 4-monooxygenase [Burkholderiaceae bacterium]|nr:phenylalanine 4-monooxygenase [Burkholderiaceae bacterium]